MAEIKKLAIFDFSKIIGRIERILQQLTSNNGNFSSDFQIIIEPVMINALFIDQISIMRRSLEKHLLSIFGCNVINSDDINSCQQCCNCVIFNTVLCYGESITNVCKELKPNDKFSKSVRVMMIIIYNRKTKISIWYCWITLLKGLLDIVKVKNS